MSEKKEKEKIKLKGQLKLYIQWPTIVAILLVAMNVWVYIIDRRAGTLMFIFVTVYIIMAGWLYLRSKSVILKDLVEFAAQYGIVQNTLLKELTVPYAIFLNDGKTIWMNDLFVEILGGKPRRDVPISKYIPELNHSIFPKEVDDTVEMDVYYKDKEYKAELRRISVEGFNDTGLLLQMPAEKEPEAKRITELSEAEQVFRKAKEQERVAFELLRRKKEGGLTLMLSSDGYGMTTAEEELFLSLALSPTEAYELVEEGFLTSEYLLDQLRQIIERVPFCAVSDVKKLLKDVKPEPEYQEHLFDIEIAAYLINPLSSQYAHEDMGKPYAALTTWKRAQMLEERLQETGMRNLFDEVEMPLVFTLYDMEQDGIRVHAEELKAYGEALTGRIGELEEQIHTAAGEKFNINSPKQLGVVLFEKLGLPEGKKTKTGYSTSAEVLDKLAPEHAIVKDILEYRQLTKLKSTYADGLAVCIAEDGRIHSNFNQTITATGRISSTEPNLQNIPVRMELGRRIRKVFIPREGCVFVDADYSQIELRVLAHMSQDEKLIEAYRQAEDIHRITASQVFHVPFEEVTPLQRRNAKAVNFGIVYGISSFGLSQDLSISTKEAKEYIDRYFETYPGIKGFLDGLVSGAKAQGYVTTMYGRRRPIPELKSSNYMQRSFGERVAMNSPIQGTAADIIKIAMIRVHDRLREEGLKSRLILQVHDELLIEAYEEEAERVEQILQEEMQQAAELDVPLEIDMHRGRNWYEAK